MSNNKDPFSASAGPTSLPSRLAVVYESPELLVVNKPAGLVCHPTKGDEFSSLISRARIHLGTGSHPQLINRLDRETSGIVVLACGPQVARELRRSWEARAIQKIYLAIVHGWVPDDTGMIDSPLGRDERSRVAIKNCVRDDGDAARTGYRVLRRFWQNPGLMFEAGEEPKPFSLLELRPETGRKHQIRIHLAHLGHPIVGDKIYVGDEDCYLALVEDRMTTAQRRTLILPHHALHALSVEFAWGGGQMRFHASPEAWFEGFAAGPDQHKP